MLLVLFMKVVGLKVLYYFESLDFMIKQGRALFLNPVLLMLAFNDYQRGKKDRNP